MSNRRSITFLILAILAVVAADVSLRFGSDKVVAMSRRSLVGISDDIERLVIERIGAPRTVLSRADGVWRLVEPYSASVDAASVMKMADAISFAPIEDVISESDLLKLGRTRGDYALDAPAVRLTAVGRDGAEETVLFGCRTPATNGVYAAISEIDAVFVVPADVRKAVDVPAEAFRNRAVLPIAAEAVSAIDLKRGAGTVLAFSRDGESWRLPEGLASSAKVKDFLGRLSSARALGFVWPVGASNETDHVTSSYLAGYGLDPDSAVTVTLKCGDGVSRQISLGKEAGDGMVYALVHGGTAIVTVSADLKDAASQDAALFADSRLVPVDIRTVASFSLTDGKDRYAFVFDKTAGWSLESPIVAPADQAAVEETLKRILSLSPSDAVTEGVAVSVVTNVEPVVVSRGAVLGNLTYESFRAKEVLRIDPATVKRVVRTGDGANATPTAVVYARDRKAWNVEKAGGGLSANGKGVAAVLAALDPLVAAKVVRLKVSAADLGLYGLDAPHLKIAVDQDAEDAVRRNVLVGAKAPGGGRYATVGSADAVFILSDRVVRSLASEIVGRK